MSGCASTYAAPEDHYVRWETFGHVCDLPHGHLGSHRCRCGQGWDAWSWMSDPNFAVRFRCRLGSPTSNDPVRLFPLVCYCEQSCEPHEHSSDDPADTERWTICLHDGVTEHGHCPNVALDSLTDADG